MITLYQDAAKTTPVTASGDPVGAMALTDGTVTEFTQATAANRPIYRTDGTRGWLEFNGASHTMTLSYSPTTYPITMAFAAENLEPATAPGTIMALQASVSDYKLVQARTSGGDSFLYANNVSGETRVTVTTTHNAPRVVIIEDDGSTMSVEVDGSTPVTQAHSRAFGSPITLELGARQGNTPFDGRLFGAIFITRLLTDAEKADVRAKLALASGATLT